MYTVTAKAAGLADAIVNKVQLLVNSPRHAQHCFEKVGAVSEVVSVSAESVPIEHHGRVARQRH